MHGAQALNWKPAGRQCPPHRRPAHPHPRHRCRPRLELGLEQELGLGPSAEVAVARWALAGDPAEARAALVVEVALRAGQETLTVLQLLQLLPLLLLLQVAAGVAGPMVALAMQPVHLAALAVAAGLTVADPCAEVGAGQQVVALQVEVQLVLAGVLPLLFLRQQEVRVQQATGL